MAEALKAALAREEVLTYIVTTKQTRYVLRILDQIGGIAFPENRIISSTVSGIPKATTLRSLMDRHPDAQSWHFVEDRCVTRPRCPLYSPLVTLSALSTRYARTTTFPKVEVK